MVNQLISQLLVFITFSSQVYYSIFVLLKFADFVFVDIINCENDDGCHDNATCSDANGSYTCLCQDGFTGDGFNCTGLLCLA